MVNESEKMFYNWLMILRPMFDRSRRWLMGIGPTRNRRAGAPQKLGSSLDALIEGSAWRRTDYKYDFLSKLRATALKLNQKKPEEWRI
jgi:hypothetical protein